MLRWLLVLLAFLVVAYVATAALAVVLGRASGGPRALRTPLVEATYGAAALAFALAVVFLVSRRTTRDVVTTLASRFPWLAPESERSREEAAIRRLLEDGGAPPMAADVPSLEVAVFVSGHTHAPGGLGAGPRRRGQHGDRQPRLLAAPAPARAGLARRPAGVRAGLRPHPPPRPVEPGGPDGGALGPPQAGRAAPAVDRARRGRGADAAPAAAHRRATAGGPAGGGPWGAQAPLTVGSAAVAAR
jgi:hypothetical protein